MVDAYTMRRQKPDAGCALVMVSMIDECYFGIRHRSARMQKFVKSKVNY